MESQTTQAVQLFSQRIAADPQLRARIRAMSSVGELMALAHELDCPLSGEDLKSLAQSAYEQWLVALPPHLRPFFQRLHTDDAVNKRHQVCTSSADVIALATEYGYDLTEADLQHAAQVAVQQDGFSFEKLWFQSLGLLSAP